MQEAVHKPLHFTTGNAPLAYALATVGFRLLAIWNRYTDPALDALKMPTATAAKAAGKPGNITYCFERRADLAATLAAWDAAGLALKAGDAINTNVEAADAIAIVRATLYGHDPFFALWKTQPAIYLQVRDGEVTSDEDPETHVKVEHYPGLRIVSDGINEEDRKTVMER